jgi:hypothetical protein
MLSDYQRYRLYEILPGLSIWATLIASIALSVVRPMWMIYFIIVFDIYWVLRVVYFSFYLILAWLRLRAAGRIDWMLKMREEAPGWRTKRHIVFLTLYNEEWSVVQTALESVAAAMYDPRAFTVVIAGEARTADRYREILDRARAAFGARLGEIIGTLHPSDLPDEIPGKGSNMHYAAREVQKLVDARGWRYDEIIATIFDIDTLCHPSYFSYLTYLYCTHPHPTHSSYQPVALYNNNLWESPAVLRLMAFGTTFWLLTSLARQDALVTFSSHSLSFRALADAGFHDKRIVSEDSRIFYQCFLAYNGDYEVTPMYVPVSMDTVRDDRWWKSVQNLYRQQRRWAWGIEHVPYLLWEFGKRPLIPFWKKFKWVFLEWEGKWSWCLVAVIITVVGRLPLLIAPESVRQSALFFNAPHILETLMNIALSGLFLSALLSFPLLPKLQGRAPHHYAMMVLQWALLPFTLLFVSSIPALDAATHMLFGRYLGFNVSQKKRT